MILSRFNLNVLFCNKSHTLHKIGEQVVVRWCKDWYKETFYSIHRQVGIKPNGLWGDVKIGIKRHSIQWSSCCSQLHCGTSIYCRRSLLLNTHNLCSTVEYTQFTHLKQKRHVLFSGTHAAGNCTAATFPWYTLLLFWKARSREYFIAYTSRRYSNSLLHLFNQGPHWQ